MDTTMISVLVTGFGAVLLTVTAMAGLVTRSIGNLRSHMDQRIDARLARTSEDVSFIKGRLTSQPEN